MPAEARLARAQGCLLGAAVGDAFGAPFEGAMEVEITELSAWAASDRPLRFTDDTAMLLTLAEYLADVGESFDEDELVRRFTAAWRAEPWRGYGPGPPAIFRQVLAGEPWERATHAPFPGGSYGNGGAMRVAPVGLLDTTLDEIASYARRSARVTHAHPLALDGAVLQAVGVALAMRARPDERLSAQDFLATIGGHISTAEFSRQLDEVQDLLESAASPGEVAEHLGNDIRAVTSVPAAMTAFLREPDDVTAALIFAVSIGGDTDTIAAMTGALAGARNGITALSKRWLARLEQRDRLFAAAGRLCR